MLAALICAPSAHAIVGGTTTTIEAHPHQVRVLVKSGNSTYSCGGSIRDATHVVTAAHCVYIKSKLAAPASVTVGYGSTTTGGLTGAAVSEVTIPSQYLNQPSYDVALLDLAAPLANYGGPKVRPIPRASAATLATGVAAEDEAVATGWGATSEGGNGSSTLKQVPLPLRDDTICTLQYMSYYVGERTVCAGGKGLALSGNPDTCQGDSGGPLALDSGAGLELVGLTSYGDGCGRLGVPAAYTETSDDEIGALIAGNSGAILKGSAGVAAPPAPVATTPVADTIAPPPPGVATRDVIRPTARVSRLSCTKKRKCTFRVAAADKGGTVKKLAANVTRKVKRCRTRGTSRFCTTTTRKKTLRPKRITGGFTFGATLAKATYKLTAVATDVSGNRSKALTKTFRVR
jgi:hypothetical protein